MSGQDPGEHDGRTAGEEILAARRAKLDRLAEAGVPAFATGFEPTDDYAKQLDITRRAFTAMSSGAA